MTEPKTVAQLLLVGERVLADSTHIFEDHDRRREAEDLLAHCAGENAPDDAERLLPPRLRDRFLALVARRAAGEPLPVLTGHIVFYGLDLQVWPGAFVPRPSSELLVARAARRLRRKRAPVVVDACTGAGPIALAIAHEVPQAEVWGTDISEEGLRQARRNARKLGIDNVNFRRGDVYAPLPARLLASVDLITAHVPYVPRDEVENLPSEVKEHEPLYTLTDDSDDGLWLMRRAVHESVEWIAPGGWLLMEMSDDMAPKAMRMCREAGYEDHGIAADDDGLSVVVEGRRPGRRRSSR